MHASDAARAQEGPQAIATQEQGFVSAIVRAQGGLWRSSATSAEEAGRGHVCPGRLASLGASPRVGNRTASGARVLAPGSVLAKQAQRQLRFVKQQEGLDQLGLDLLQHGGLFAAGGSKSRRAACR